MSDTTPVAVTKVYPSSAAANRAHRVHRDALISALGWAPEGTGGDAYLASTVELERWVNEKRAAIGQAGRIIATSFTTTFNMQKVKTLTVFAFNARGELIPS